MSSAQSSTASSSSLNEELNIYCLHSVCEDPKNLHEHLVKWNLIPQVGDYKCSKCGFPLNLIKDTNRIDHLKWVCRNKLRVRGRKRQNCGNTASYRAGTFFMNSKLTIHEILVFAHMWVERIPLRFIGLTLSKSEHTVADWASLCREVVIDSMIKKKVKLGGEGITVEIDECKYGHRKIHHGHYVDELWVVGGYERGTGRIFLVPVEDRTQETLLNVIEKWILPGTTIISDCWQTYDCLNTEGFRQLAMNYSITFKDTRMGDHTNSIKSSWGASKSLTESSDRNIERAAGNLPLHMFLGKCRHLKLNPTLEFFRSAGELYDARHPRTEIIQPDTIGHNS